MKKLNSILFCAVAAFAVASCNKEAQEVPEAKSDLVPMTFTATTTETRTALDEDHVSIKWLTTDKISVFDGTANRMFTSNGEGTTVQFTGEAADFGNYLAVYPYNENIQFSATRAETTLADVQTPVNGSFADGLNINAALSADKSSFHFENVLSVAKFTLSASNLGGKTIKSVKFASTHPLAGDVSVRISPEGISASAGDNTVNEVTMTSESGLADGTYYFVVLPNAGGEIKMTFIATDGSVAQRIATLGKPFTAGNIKNLGSVKGLVWLGAPWSYTLKNTDVNSTEHSLANTNWNGKNWEVNGPTWYGWDTAKGVQFGTSSNPTETMTLSSNFGEGYKIEKIVVNASGAKDIIGTLSVSVGGTALKCNGETSVSLTNSATDYSFVIPAEELVEGAIVITLSQTSSKALYVKSIAVNPDLEDESIEVVTLNGDLQINDDVKKSFKVGDPFSLGEGTVTASYSDGSTKDVSNLVVVSGFDSSEATDSQEITLTYTENGASASVSYNIVIRSNNVQTYTVTYTVGTTRKVNITSGTAPEGSTETFLNTYNTATQMTGGNSQTLTLSGYSGAVIKGITLSMHSNKSAGSGHFTCYAGDTMIAGFTGNKTWRTWYNIKDWSQSFTDVIVEMLNENYVIKDNEDVILKIEASANSLFNQSFTITYEL